MDNQISLLEKEISHEADLLLGEVIIRLVHRMSRVITNEKVALAAYVKLKILKHHTVKAIDRCNLKINNEIFSKNLDYINKEIVYAREKYYNAKFDNRPDFI